MFKWIVLYILEYLVPRLIYLSFSIQWPNQLQIEEYNRVQKISENHYISVSHEMRLHWSEINTVLWARSVHFDAMTSIVTCSSFYNVVWVTSLCKQRRWWECSQQYQIDIKKLHSSACDRAFCRYRNQHKVVNKLFCLGMIRHCICQKHLFSPLY